MTRTGRVCWTWGFPALAMMLTLGAPGSTAAEEEGPVFKYIGVEACGRCHKKEKTGDQLGQWMGTGHAKAYETLASPAAKKIAAEKGIADPQKAQECLQCHVTQPAEGMVEEPRAGREGFLVEHGVQCETCHGPGSEYKSMRVMKDREASIANGMVVPTKEMCLTCHNEKSPTYKPFKFEEAWAKVNHPNPERAAE